MEPKSDSRTVQPNQVEMTGGNINAQEITLPGFSEMRADGRQVTTGELNDPIGPYDSRNLQRIGYFSGNNGTLVYVQPSGMVLMGPDNETNRATLKSLGYREDDGTHQVPTPRTEPGK